MPLEYRTPESPSRRTPRLLAAPIVVGLALSWIGCLDMGTTDDYRQLEDQVSLGQACGKSQTCFGGECTCGAPCDAAHGEFGTCRAAPFDFSIGAGCAKDSECLSGICDATSHVCVGLSAKAACDTDAQCDSGACQFGACAEGDGGACSVDDDCAPKLVCADLVCRHPLLDGVACTDASQCSPHRCIDGTCGKQPGGAACSSADDCLSAQCQSGVCTGV